MFPVIHGPLGRGMGELSKLPTTTRRLTKFPSSSWGESCKAQLGVSQNGEPLGWRLKGQKKDMAISCFSGSPTMQNSHLGVSQKRCPPQKGGFLQFSFKPSFLGGPQELWVSSWFRMNTSQRRVVPTPKNRDTVHLGQQVRAPLQFPRGLRLRRLEQRWPFLFSGSRVNSTIFFEVPTQQKTTTWINPSGGIDAPTFFCGSHAKHPPLSLEVGSLSKKSWWTPPF